MKNYLIIAVLFFLAGAISMYFYLNKPIEVDFSKYDKQISKLISDTTRLFNRCDSLSKIDKSEIDTFIQVQIKNHIHHDTIYINLNSISYDSALQFRAIKRGQFRSYYRL